MATFALPFQAHHRLDTAAGCADTETEAVREEEGGITMSDPSARYALGAPSGVKAGTGTGPLSSATSLSHTHTYTTQEQTPRDRQFMSCHAVPRRRTRIAKVDPTDGFCVSTDISQDAKGGPGTCTARPYTTAQVVSGIFH